jgi:hypothetical protein
VLVTVGRCLVRIPVKTILEQCTHPAAEKQLVSWLIISLLMMSLAGFNLRMAN